MEWIDNKHLCYAIFLKEPKSFLYEWGEGYWRRAAVFFNIRFLDGFDVKVLKHIFYIKHLQHLLG